MSFNVANAWHRFSAGLAEKLGCFYSFRPVLRAFGLKKTTAYAYLSGNFFYNIRL
jgi:hypothetical protein